MSNPAVPFATGAADGPAAPFGAPTPHPGFEYVQLSTVRRWLPVVILLVVGVACLIAVVPLYRHGVDDHAFPSYVEGGSPYEVRRYTAPWIAGALALGGLGIIMCILAIARVVTTRGVPVEHPQSDEPTLDVNGTSPRSAADPSPRLPVLGASSAPSEHLLARPTEAANEY